MKSIDGWLDEYGESHQNPTNKAIHWVCVPLIVLSLLGVLWSVPVPQAFVDISPAMNWATLFMMASLVYYFIMSIPLALGMILVVALFGAALYGLAALPVPLWITSLAIFVVAWIGQFIGHVIEGKKPSFFKDVQFLMIGPMWLLSFVYRRLGISY